MMIRGRLFILITCVSAGINQGTFGAIFWGLSSASSTAVDCAEIPSSKVQVVLDIPDKTTKTESDGLSTCGIMEPVGTSEKNSDNTTPTGNHITQFVAECQMPSTFGSFLVRSYVYTSKSRRMEPVVMISGNIKDKENVLVRVHDQCFTSEVLGSLRCDCREQLHSFLTSINNSNDGGILIYLQQEGRGIGLSNKIAAYSLQDIGYDTVDANTHLGFKDEMREYNVIPDILNDLGVKSIRLATNNPFKVATIAKLGVKINERVPLQVECNMHNSKYMESKRDRMGHDILPSVGRQPISHLTSPSSAPSTASKDENRPSHMKVEETIDIEPQGGSCTVENYEPSSAYAFGKETVEAAIAAVARGEVVVVVDDENRENEGDLIMSAAMATPDSIGFIVRFSSGVLCVSLEGSRLDELNLPPMVVNNEDPKQTAYSVSVDFKLNTTTGISSADRALTFRALTDPSYGPDVFQRPGHVFPLRYKKGGVLTRAGHTEASLDLTRLAGLHPGGVLAEIVHDDGSLMRLPSLIEFSKKHGLILTSVQDLIAYRMEMESLSKT